jgi:LysM repeat protein
MKKQLFYFLLAGFFLFSTSTSAQNSNLPTKKINGTEYYIYSVEVSEGLNAIGRKFNVSPDEITKANPEVKDGLRFGQKILIPIQKNSTNNTVQEKKATQEFIQHKVKKRQTLFAISRIYNISQDDIKKYNPETENGLKEGLILQIPVIEKEDKNSKVELKATKSSENGKANNGTANQKKPITHIVKAGETLYSISKMYNVEIEKIVGLNPGSDKKLSIGTELKIVSDSIVSKTTNQKEDEIRKSSGTQLDFESIFNKKKTEDIKAIRIAYLLPFMLDNSRNDNGADRFINFYAGSLLAIKEAKQKGISLEIFTYDTDKTEEKLLEVLNNPEIKTMDFIIGPAFSNQVPVMADFSKKHNINTLIPFTSKVPDIEYNPYLFQFNPGIENELNFTTELFTGKYKNMNIIFADIPDISIYDDGKIMSEKLKKNLSGNRRTFATLNLNSADYADFSTVLKKGDKNLIIFNTDKFAYISPFLNALKNNSDAYNIILFEQFTWKDQPEKLNQGIYISPFISDCNKSDLDKFNQKFSANFKWNNIKEIPRFDLLGYDITNYFIALLQQYGNKFPTKIYSKVNADFIQSQPKFERSSSKSGFINQQIYLTTDKNK